MPMTAAAHGATKAHGAVMATRPASMPLAIMPGSGLPVRHMIQNIATIDAEGTGDGGVGRHDGELDVGRRRSVDAALKPNQPNSRMNVPSMAIGMWWPGSARGVPSLANLPMRGPSTMAPASAATPPTVWTTPEPAKST